MTQFIKYHYDKYERLLGIVRKEKKQNPTFVRLFSYAVTTRLELATSGVTGRHSNQLNYATGLRRCKIKLFFDIAKESA